LSSSIPAAAGGSPVAGSATAVLIVSSGDCKSEGKANVMPWPPFDCPLEVFMELFERRTACGQLDCCITSAAAAAAQQ
jgi:hypothetical protein